MVISCFWVVAAGGLPLQVISAYLFAVVLFCAAGA
jgi:hypothetical protein